MCLRLSALLFVLVVSAVPSSAQKAGAAAEGEDLQAVFGSKEEDHGSDNAADVNTLLRRFYSSDASLEPQDAENAEYNPVAYQRQLREIHKPLEEAIQRRLAMEYDQDLQPGYGYGEEEYPSQRWARSSDGSDVVDDGYSQPYQQQQQSSYQQQDAYSASGYDPYEGVSALNPNKPSVTGGFRSNGLQEPDLEGAK